MPRTLSIPIPNPSPRGLEDFCAQYGVRPRAVFQLAWALVQHSYFDTCEFVYDQQGGHRGLYDDFPTLISFLPELAKSSRVIATVQWDGMQEPGQDTILLHSEVEGVDASLKKVWSRLILFHDSTEEWSGGDSLCGKDFDIEIQVHIESSDLSIRMDYDPVIADMREMGDVARAFHQALESILTIGGRQSVAEITLLNPQDATTIFEWNSTTPSMTEDCLHLLIERSVTRNPDSQALLSWDGSLTYTELDQLSSRLAHYLLDNYDLGPEKVVPLCFEKSIWAVVAMLAVLKTGSAYCCLDPAHPQTRRDYMTELVDAQIALCCEAHVDRIQKCSSLIIDAGFVRALQTSPNRPETTVEPSNAAVIAFTSGTTGNPKAIIHSHTSVCSGLLANAPVQRINRSDIRLFQWAAYTFDVSITETFSPLIFGGLVCIPSEEERLNDVEVAMTRMNVDWAYFTPTFARFFRRYTIPSLTQLILGGEAVTVDDVRDWRDRVRVLNAYGPAESITWFLEPQLGVSSTIPIGKPINMRAWIVSPDDHTRLMPIGAIGELLLEGTSLFREYIKNEEKTEQVLISPPKWRREADIGPALKMYKTGDLVRYLPDGNMTYIGRKDTMVKLYGQRMELDEVETMLRRSLPESVQASADVIKPAGENEEAVLVAFFCVPKGFGQSLQELKVHAQSKLAEALPAFMVPRIYIPVDEMPFNSSRKLDRAKLRQTVSSLTRSELVGLLQAKEPAAPQDEFHSLNTLEADLQRLWAKALLLDPSQIGPDANFFALGGSSVTVLKVTAAAKSEGIAISYQDLFRAPTLRGLSQIVSRVSGTAQAIPPFSLIEEQARESVLSDAVAQCGVAKEEIEDIYPLAPQQQGLWALSLIRDGDYMAQFILTLDPDVEISKFFQAWQTVADRVPTLRTRFIESASGSYQVVTKGSPINWETRTDINTYLEEDIQREVAFGSPLVRYAVFPSVTKDGVTTPTKIVWTMHHALFDGESVPMLLNTVARAYQGTPPSTEIGPFNRFIQYVQGINEPSAQEFWEEQFSGKQLVAYPPLPNPNYRPHPESVYEKHIQFARRMGSSITTATLLRAALSLSLAKMAGTAEVAMGVTLAGRTAPVSNIESVIGPTFVSIPTSPIDGSEHMVFDYLEQLQASIVDTIPFEHTGMQKIAQFSPESNAACQFQTILLVQTPDDTGYRKLFQFDDSTGGYGRFNSHSLMVLLFTNANGVDAAFSYDRAVISDEQVASLAYVFERCIHTLCLEEEMRPVSSVIAGDSAPQRVLATSSSAPKTLVKKIVSRTKEPAANGTVIQSDGVEAILADAWTDVLGIADKSAIKPDDEFVRTYGGNSLLSLKLAQYCRERGLRLAVKDIFQYPRFGDMARAAILISNKTKDQTSPSIPPFSLIESGGLTNGVLAGWKKSVTEEASETCSVPVDSIQDIYPSTPLQEGLVVLSMTKPGAYISRTAYELAPTVDIDRFRNAWATVYQAENILRTRLFQPTGTREAFQVVISDQIQWEQATDLTQFMAENQNLTLGFGDRLSRFTLVQDRESSKRFFVLTVHHALYDGWSMPLLLQKVYETYFAVRSSKTYPPFNTFIQHTTRSRPVDTREFWAKQFQDAEFVHFPAPLLPSEKPGVQTQLESSVSFRQPKSPGILKSTILRAAWAMVLNTYTRRQDVVFGATLAGRNVAMAGIENLIGPTLTTVPIRVQVDKKEQLEAFLRRIQNQSIDMIDYEHTGLHTIRSVSVEATNFQNLLVLQPKSTSTAAYSNLWVSETQGDTSQFFSYPLVIQCSFSDDDDAVDVAVTFDQVRIHQTEAVRLMRLYEHILTQLSSLDSATTLGDIDLVSPGDILELQEQISTRSPPEVVDRLLHDSIFKTIHEYPDKIAVTSSWGESLTYGQLDDASSRLAHDLIRAGAGSGTFIPLFFDKDIWAIVAMIAVLKAGSAFVPMDPESPAARRNQILGQINASIILSSPKYIGIHEIGEVRQINRQYIDGLPTLDQTERALERRPTTADPAYTIFTSGSTGIPKGVVVSHRAVSSSINAHGKAMGFNEDTRALQFCSYTFDVSIAEIFATLAFGGTICVPSSLGRVNNLAAEIRTLEANWSFLTPSVARLLDPADVPTLRTLVLGGEEVGPGDVARWSEDDGLRIMNGYGPTEACVFCITRVIDTPESANVIGRPIGCYAVVVDPEDHGKLAPVGAVGEMLVCGPILASGYLNDPARTEAVFVPAPAWARALLGDAITEDTLFYKTGDLVRYNHDGLLEYMSRKDLQVKVRGLRIEVEDVEHWIQTTPEVKHAVVVVSRGSVGSSASTQLVAVLSLTTRDRVDSPALTLNASDDARRQVNLIKVRLEENLPAYAVPNAWLCVNEIPLSTSGKTSRKDVKEWVGQLSKEQFLELSSAQTNGSAEGPRPSGQTEEAIASIWSRILDIPQDDVRSNKPFFGYGGDSISAMRVVKESRKQSLDISIQDLLLAKGISDLATKIQGKSDQPSANGAAEILTEETINGDDSKDVLRKGTYPVTPLQQAMIEKHAEGFYNVEMIFQVHSATPLDIPRLQGAWSQVVQRHSALRTLFVKSDAQGEYLQHITHNPVQTLHEGQDTNTALAIDSSVSPNPVWPVGGLLHRLTVQNTPNGTPNLKLEISHAITDAVSLGTVFRDLELAYDGVLPSTPAPQISQYFQHIGSQAQQDSAYWRKYAANASPSHIPRLSKSSTPVMEQVHTPVSIPAGKLISLFCREQGITVANLIHAVWALVLKRHTGYAAEVSFGYLVSGRDVEMDGIEQVVGPLISMLLCRKELPAQMLVQDLLAEMRDDAIQSSSRKFCEIKRIEQELGLDQGLFNTMINFRKYPKPVQEEKTSVKFEYINGRDPFEYDLSLVIDEVENDWQVHLVSWAHRINDGQARGIAVDFSRILEAVIASPEKSISNTLQVL